MAQQWFYTNKGKEKGPVSEAELRDMVGTGALKPTDMVWNEDMANWARASTIRALFPEAGAISSLAAPAPRSSSPRTNPAGSRTDDLEGVPRRRERRRADSDSDDDDDLDVRRKRRRAAPASMSSGAVIALLTTGCLVLVAVVVGAAVLLARKSGPAVGNPPAAPAEAGLVMTYTVDVQVQGQDIRPITLTAGKRYEFHLKAANQAGDLDIFIMNNLGQDLAKDDGIAADAYIDFTAPYSGLYRIDVFNAGVVPNQGTITVLDKGPSPNPANQVIPRQDNKVPPVVQPPPFPKPIPPPPAPNLPFKQPKVSKTQPPGPLLKVVPGEFFSTIQSAVKENRLADVDITGFKTSASYYRDTVEEGGILVGLQLGIGRFANHESITALRPIYLTQAGEKMGAWHGPTPAAPVTIKAKPGYIVGGVNLRAGVVLTGLALNFMKLANDHLEPGDNYASEWVGAQVGSIRTIGGQGTVFVGVCGHLNRDGATSSLGLVGILDNKKS